MANTVKDLDLTQPRNALILDNFNKKAIELLERPAQELGIYLSGMTPWKNLAETATEEVLEHFAGLPKPLTDEQKGAVKTSLSEICENLYEAAKAHKFAIKPSTIKHAVAGDPGTVETVYKEYTNDQIAASAEEKARKNRFNHDKLFRTVGNTKLEEKALKEGKVEAEGQTHELTSEFLSALRANYADVRSVCETWYDLIVLTHAREKDSFKQNGRTVRYSSIDIGEFLFDPSDYADEAAPRCFDLYDKMLNALPTEAKTEKWLGAAKDDTKLAALAAELKLPKQMIERLANVAASEPDLGDYISAKDILEILRAEEQESEFFEDYFQTQLLNDGIDRDDDSQKDAYAKTREGRLFDKYERILEGNYEPYDENDDDTSPDTEPEETNKPQLPFEQTKPDPGYVTPDKNADTTAVTKPEPDKPEYTGTTPGSQDPAKPDYTKPEPADKPDISTPDVEPRTNLADLADADSAALPTKSDDQDKPEYTGTTSVEKKPEPTLEFTPDSRELIKKLATINGDEDSGPPDIAKLWPEKPKIAVWREGPNGAEIHVTTPDGKESQNITEKSDDDDLDAWFARDDDDDSTSEPYSPFSEPNADSVADQQPVSTKIKTWLDRQRETGHWDSEDQDDNRYERPALDIDGRAIPPPAQQSLEKKVEKRRGFGWIPWTALAIGTVVVASEALPYLFENKNKNAETPAVGHAYPIEVDAEALPELDTLMRDIKRKMGEEAAFYDGTGLPKTSLTFFDKADLANVIDSVLDDSLSVGRITKAEVNEARLNLYSLFAYLEAGQLVQGEKLVSEILRHAGGEQHVLGVRYKEPVAQTRPSEGKANMAPKMGSKSFHARGRQADYIRQNLRR
ncbi:hypothetical protein KY329_03045 [Candidatus Woesearchaeota archaeon]|nr:hypothetical protein [Candidatus Woesearchaeota archaeon]